MTYIALLYSPSLDQVETDWNTAVYCIKDMAEWLKGVCDHYNRYFNAKDFELISVNKVGT